MTKSSMSHFFTVMQPDKATLEMKPQEVEFFFDRAVSRSEAEATIRREGYRITKLIKILTGKADNE